MKYALIILLIPLFVFSTIGVSITSLYCKGKLCEIGFTVHPCCNTFLFLPDLIPDFLLASFFEEAYPFKQVYQSCYPNNGLTLLNNPIAKQILNQYED